MQRCELACSSFTASYYSFESQFCKKPSSRKGKPVNLGIWGWGGRRSRVRVFWCWEKQAEVLCDSAGWLKAERSCREAVKALGQHFSPSSLAMRYHSQNKE